MLLLGLTGDELVGLLDSHDEVIVVLEDIVDLLDVQVDKHTSDLWSFITLQLLDEFENCGTNRVLVVWVFGNDGFHNRNATLQVGILDRQRRLDLLLLRGEAWHHIVLLNRHLLNLTLHAHDLRVMAHISLHSAGLGAATIAVLSVLALFVIIWACLAWVLNMLWSITVGGSWAGSLTIWHLLEEFLEHFKEHLLLNAHSRLLEAMFLTESYKVELVLVLFVLDFADFLNFVMVDLECATLELDALEIRHSLARGVWSLKAYKAVWVLALFLRKESDAFDFTVLAEEVTDVLL